MLGNLESLPVLPLKNTVVYPQLVVPLAVGRPASVAAVDAARQQEGDEQYFICLAQRDAEVDSPGTDDLYEVGTVVAIRRLERGEQGLQVLVQGVQRVHIGDVVQDSPHLEVRYSLLPDPAGEGPEIDALVRENLETAQRIATLFDEDNGEKIFQNLIASIRDPMTQHYRMASLASLDVEQEQRVLEADTLLELLQTMHEILDHERKITELRREIAESTKSDIEKQQREAFLRQQKRAIEEALGEHTPEEAEATELRRRLDEAKLPDSVRQEAERECARLERMNAQAPDYQMTRSYLELIVELPWYETTEDNLDLDHARDVLDEDHYGLDEIKTRILEFLAVMKLNPDAQAPILCLVGPPGVGKTSLGQSVARAIGRKFERLSLGGLHDEAELRGHRRTYIGAMPGRIIQGVRRAETKNPILMLDEVDKLGRDFRGDPAAALMEILDPAQNREFRDNYLNMPFDLSKVFFITTANTLDTIPRPLLDRMEVLELSGYSQDEKAQIAKRYLIPRQRREAGLSEAQLQLTEDALTVVIQRYTREAGVRELERTIGRLARKTARRVLDGEEAGTIDRSQVTEMLGPERFFPEEARRELPPGVAAGLAWTEAGGDVLYVEAALMPKEDKVTLTGHLGDVMKESAYAARSWLWSAANRLALDVQRIAENGVHVHVPAGAVPKDGPSAGVTMACALASIYSGKAVRADIAMTGELTLSGLVLPVGGVKEKVLAAHRAGLKTVMLPKQNRHDLEKLPEQAREEMHFVLVERIEEVLETAIPGLMVAPAASVSTS